MGSKGIGWDRMRLEKKAKENRWERKGRSRKSWIRMVLVLGRTKRHEEALRWSLGHRIIR